MPVHEHDPEFNTADTNLEVNLQQLPDNDPQSPEQLPPVGIQYLEHDTSSPDHEPHGVDCACGCKEANSLASSLLSERLAAAKLKSGITEAKLPDHEPHGVDCACGCKEANSLASSLLSSRLAAAKRKSEATLIQADELHDGKTEPAAKHSSALPQQEITHPAPKENSKPARSEQTAHTEIRQHEAELLIIKELSDADRASDKPRRYEIEQDEGKMHELRGSDTASKTGNLHPGKPHKHSPGPSLVENPEPILRPGLKATPVSPSETKRADVLLPIDQKQETSSNTGIANSPHAQAPREKTFSDMIEQPSDSVIAQTGESFFTAALQTEPAFESSVARRVYSELENEASTAEIQPTGTHDSEDPIESYGKLIIEDAEELSSSVEIVNALIDDQETSDKPEPFAINAPKDIEGSVYDAHREFIDQPAENTFDQTVYQETTTAEPLRAGIAPILYAELLGSRDETETTRRMDLAAKDAQYSKAAVTTLQFELTLSRYGLLFSPDQKSQLYSALIEGDYARFKELLEGIYRLGQDDYQQEFFASSIVPQPAQMSQKLVKIIALLKKLRPAYV